MSPKIGDIVLCVVKQIDPASVSVEIEGNGTGSIVMSEIAAGRIRNLREYAAPNKKIVCKVISIDKDNTRLSLRRVTAKEKEECLLHYQKEKTFSTMLKSNIKDYEKVISSIKETHDLADFYDEAKTNPKILEKHLKKTDAEQIEKILAEKKETSKQAKAVFILRTLDELGLNEIKNILSKENADIHYLGSSQFSISARGRDFKEANLNLSSSLQKIENEAKAKKIFFRIKEEK